jgi:hypothetical protein
MQQPIFDQAHRFIWFFILLTSYSSVSFSASQLRAKDLGSLALTNHHCSASQTIALTKDLYLSNYSQPLATTYNVPHYTLFEGFSFGDYVYGESAVLNDQLMSGFIYSNGRSLPYLYGLKVGGKRLTAYDVNGNHYDLLTHINDQPVNDCYH